MARSYGRFTTSIYRDDDFKALTLAQQGVYFMLGLQPEVSAAGMLPLTTRRWSRLARGTTAADLRSELQMLEELGHVLVDEDTEELLIVKFVKWDQGYTNSKRLPVIREAALGIESPILRRALVEELSKLGLSDMASELIADTPPDTTPDSPSDAVSPSDRVVVKKRNQIPQPSTLNPQPPGRAAADAPPGAIADAIRAYVAACAVPPASDLQDRVERSARRLLAEGHPPELVTAAAGSAGRSGWTDLAVQIQRDAANTRAAPNGGRPSTTDARVTGAVEAGRAVGADLADFAPRRELT